MISYSTQIVYWATIIQWLSISFILYITVLDLLLRKRAVGEGKNYSTMIMITIPALGLGLSQHKYTSQLLLSIAIVTIPLIWLAIMLLTYKR